MPNPGISPENSRRYKATVERCLKEGFTPPRQGGGRGSAIEEAARRLYAEGVFPSQRTGAARLWRWRRTQEMRRARGDDHDLPDWSVYAEPGKPAEAIGVRRVERWILTSAQDETDLHHAFWNNLRAYAAYLGASILVGGFTYQKGLYEDHRTRTAAYPSELREYLRHEPIEVGAAVFFAEMNILPTAVDPLSGLESYGRGRTAIFPHAKHRLRSIPVSPADPPIQALTTGACTVENYVEKKAGHKARFHHIVGAVVVEATAEFTWHRHVSASSDGTFQDLNNRVANGRVYPDERAEAVTFGDIHHPYHSPEITEALWGRREDSLVERLRPRHAVLHDLTDLRPVSRYEEGNAHHSVRMAARGENRVQDHMVGAARLCREIERDWMQVHIAESNHDQWLERWCRQSSVPRDPANARYWYELNAAALRAIESGDEDFHLWRHALAAEDSRRLDGINFVREGGTLVIGGVELGTHGHRGPNGAKGTAASLARSGRKQTIGDKHSPEVFEGLFVAGVTCDLDQGYNRGPSGWAHAHVVQYPTGKRTLVFQSPDGRWCA